MRHFCLALPDGVHAKIKAVCVHRGITVTAYIRGAAAARLQSDLSGQRFCAEGSPCILALMPNYSQLASSAKSVLDRSPVLDLGGQAGG